MFRAAKNSNGVIICIGTDEGQVGNYPLGAADDEKLGDWCSWTCEELPPFSAVEGLDSSVIAPMRFKENGTADGIELRSDAEVLASPNE